jgi:hypothetical protein
VAAADALTVLLTATDGWWILEASEVPGCRTFAPNLPDGLRRLRDALSLVRADAGRVQLVPRATGELGDLLDHVARLRGDAATATAAADAATRAAARSLTERGISRRDAGALLGLSRQRIQQLIDGAEGRGTLG